MIARRQVFLTILSVIAALTVPTTTRAAPLLGPTRIPQASGDEESFPTGDEEFNFGTVIKVIGVGGAGCNMVEHMVACETRGTEYGEYIYANNDSSVVRRKRADKIIWLGAQGVLADGLTETGGDCIPGTEDGIRAALAGAHMVFVVAGMGGGTGTVAAPAIAGLAKEMGILTVGIATLPFAWEGTGRMRKAVAGLAELEASVDSLIVLPNENLLENLGDDVAQAEAFARVDEVVTGAVGGIVEIINNPGLVNVDFEDVRTVMSVPGKAIVGTAVATGPDRASIAAKLAMDGPLLESIDLSGAKGILVLVSTAERSLKLSESKLAMNIIRACSLHDAHVIYGTANNDCLGEKIRVTVIATGVTAGAHSHTLLHKVS